MPDSFSRRWKSSRSRHSCAVPEHATTRLASTASDNHVMEQKLGKLPIYETRGGWSTRWPGASGGRTALKGRTRSPRVKAGANERISSLSKGTMHTTQPETSVGPGPSSGLAKAVDVADGAHRSANGSMHPSKHQAALNDTQRSTISARTRCIAVNYTSWSPKDPQNVPR